MKKISFKNDYSEGAHPRILESLQDSNFLQDDGYGQDSYSKKAIELIQEKLGQSSDVHLVSGGTQANLIIISSILKPYESVIAANTGHIAVHETGAIEATGHKINTIESKTGKIKPEDIKKVLDFHTGEHMVKPKLVYISNSTETGTIYTKEELENISIFCKNNDLYLFMDGARLASALTSQENDIDFKDLSMLVDIFYIGGTKAGALLGEAIVINNSKLKENFRFHLKQKGAMLAKGRILGIQFLELFKDDLFFELGLHANKMAMKLVDAIENKGYIFYTKPESNQIFPILPNNVIETLKKDFDFYIWEKVDEKNSAIRLVTSWATNEEQVEQFINTLNNI